MIWSKVCFGLLVCIAAACQPTEKGVEQKVETADSRQGDGDLVSIVSESKQDGDQLRINIKVVNEGDIPIYIRGDYYYIELHGDERGVTLPDDNWSGNVISLVRPSMYGSIGQNQVGPFAWRKPLFLRVAHHDSSRITFRLRLPIDLIQKGIVGDSFLVSIPYWRSIDSINSQAIVRNEGTPLILTESLFSKDTGTRHIAYTMIGDSVTPNADYISKMNSYVTKRLQYWGMIK